MNKIKAALSALMASFGCLGGAQASTVSIGFSPGSEYSASGISELEVGSAGMSGMRVEMCFAGGTPCEVKSWGLEGVSGDGWSLQAGETDTFLEAFNLTVGERALQSFTLYGLEGLTVFDILRNQDATPSLRSSPGSGDGRAFTLEAGEANVERYNVNYFDSVRVGGELYGDLYLGMRVDFTMSNNLSGFSGELLFITDTDRIAVPPNNPVPEPGSLALVGAALLGLGAARVRSR